MPGYRPRPPPKRALMPIEVLRGMNTGQRPQAASRCTDRFPLPRWQKLVMIDAGIDRRYYELCALSELKNPALATSGRRVHAVQGLRGPPCTARSSSPALKQSSELPLAVATDCEQQYRMSGRRCWKHNCHRQPHGGSQRPAGCHHHRKSWA